MSLLQPLTWWLRFSFFLLILATPFVIAGYIAYRELVHIGVLPG